MQQQQKKMIESNEVISKEDVEVRRFIEERLTSPKQRLTEVSMDRMKRQEEIRRTLEDLKGIKNISRHGKELLMSLGSSTASCVMKINMMKQRWTIDKHGSFPEVTRDEIQKAIKRLKKGKAVHSNGIRAEDMKICDAKTKCWKRLPDLISLSALC